MAVNFNPAVNSVSIVDLAKAKKKDEQVQSFAETVKKHANGVNDDQANANQSIADLITGKNQDINSVVANVAKADMSFKMLVGVRNKLVTAYQETMKMQV